MTATKVAFKEATRAQNSILAPMEKTCLIWLARHAPSFINSDHLTALGIISMFFAGLSYMYAPTDSRGLLLVILFLALNWLGDSLDGTLARVRNKQRPRYGFYVDHVVDCFGALFLLGGLALSGYMSPGIALGLLIAFLLLSCETYLATYTIGTFHISFWKFGPTELRILLAAGNIALLLRPAVVKVFGNHYLLFDVGGAVGIAGMGFVLIFSVIQHTRQLYRAEPIS